MTSMLEQLQTILESAVRRQPAGFADELLPALTVKELSLGFGLQSVDLWSVDGIAIECVATSVPDGLAVEPEGATRGRLEAAAAAPGQLFEDHLKESSALRQTIGVEAATGWLLVLELRGKDIPAGLAESAAEILADLFRRSQLGVLRRFREGIGRLEQMLPALYGATSESALGAVLSADLPAVVGCSRACVCRREAVGWRMESATGTDGVNERAEAVVRICRAVSEQAKRQGGGAFTGPPEGGGQLLVPLSVSGVWSESERALVVEFTGTAKPDRELLQRVLLQIRGALRNLRAGSQSREARPAVRLFVLSRLRLLIAATAAVVLALALIPLEFRVSATGRLLPSQRLQVHAPEAGIVTQVAVRDGAPVSQGQLLMQLRSDELLLELETVLGQTAASAARLAAIEQLKASRSADMALLTAEQAELSAGMESLRLRRKLIERRLEALDVRAEFSGRVYADDVSERLTGKPLQRGQLLLELANPQGTWELQLEVPEREARHVMLAAAEGAPVISFFSESAPGAVHTTQVSRISESAVINGAGQLVLQVRADVAAQTLRGVQERPGAGVRAEIACGQRSLGYVLLRKFVEFVQRGGR
ncbi:MAG: HlyD family efflux transporter periplasmic adaptor subunit [Planctomycetota bacterium]